MLSKLLFSGDVRVIRSYHVQFFGNEAERGWINEPSVMAFEGKLKFLDMAQQELAKGKKGKSGYNPFKINISRRHAWNIAVEEAEGAMPLSREERFVQYMFEYVFMDDLKKEQQKLKQEADNLKTEDPGAVKSKTGVKRKRTSEEGNNLSPVLNKYKKRKIEDTGLHPETPAGAKTSFDTYYANHRSSVIEQHPEWDTPLVFEYLRQQWESEKKKTSKPKGPYPATVQNSSKDTVSPSVPLVQPAGKCCFFTLCCSVSKIYRRTT